MFQCNTDLAPTLLLCDSTDHAGFFSRTPKSSCLLCSIATESYASSPNELMCMHALISVEAEQSVCIVANAKAVKPLIETFCGVNEYANQYPQSIILVPLVVCEQ